MIIYMTMESNDSLRRPGAAWLLSAHLTKLQRGDHIFHDLAETAAAGEAGCQLKLVQ